MRSIISYMSVLMIILGGVVWGWYVFHGESSQQLIGIGILCFGGCGFVLS